MDKLGPMKTETRPHNKNMKDNFSVGQYVANCTIVSSPYWSLVPACFIGKKSQLLFHWEEIDSKMIKHLHFFPCSPRMMPGLWKITVPIYVPIFILFFVFWSHLVKPKGVTFTESQYLISYIFSWPLLGSD